MNEAWLVFREGHHKFQRIIKKGWGHISIIYKDKYNWLLVMPSEVDVKIFIMPYPVSKNVPALINSDKMKVVKVIYGASQSKRFCRILIGFTCVSFVKYFLGYKDWSITPHQLYKSLCRLKKNIIKVERI